MSSVGSVTHWITQLKAGDPLAAQRLWEAYFLRLVKLARKKLEGTPRRAADEEDVALSAFDSLCRGTEAGRFPQLKGRDHLWQLLAAITAHKALDLARREGRLKRGGRPRNERALPGAEDLQADEASLEQVFSREPTPELAVQMAEEFQRLLDLLGDDTLRAVALARMEGRTVDEIAAQLGCAPRTVDRKLQVIRSLWAHETLP
jgi:DNA-directed RNA polymerase specialized sigma24 family protein